jgi:hypothetical protein
MIEADKIEWIADDTPVFHPTSTYRIPTLQEKLARIQAEIAKIDKHEYPDKELCDHLKSREIALMAEIEKEAGE